MTGSVLTAWPVRGPAPRSLSRGTGRPGRRTEWQQQSHEPVPCQRHSPGHTVPRGIVMAARHTPGERRQSQPEPIEIARDVTHPARVYDYVRGGDDNFTADREVVDFAVAAGSGGFDHARAAGESHPGFPAPAAAL